MEKLQYCKKILEKVSFNNVLLRKEYVKALKMLSGEEAGSLDVWYQKKFGNGSRKSSVNSKKS